MVNYWFGYDEDFGNATGLKDVNGAPLALGLCALQPGDCGSPDFVAGNYSVGLASALQVTSVEGGGVAVAAA